MVQLQPGTPSPTAVAGGEADLPPSVPHHVIKDAYWESVMLWAALLERPAPAALAAAAPVGVAHGGGGGSPNGSSRSRGGGTRRRALGWSDGPALARDATVGTTAEGLSCAHTPQTLWMEGPIVKRIYNGVWVLKLLASGRILRRGSGPRIPRCFGWRLVVTIRPGRLLQGARVVQRSLTG